MSEKHEDSNCLHCIILSTILMRAKMMRAQGIEHDTLEDTVRVAEVLAQLIGSNPNKESREEVYAEIMTLLPVIFERSKAQTDDYVAAKGVVPAGVMRH